MTYKDDYTGRKFGRLTVIEKEEKSWLTSNHKEVYWFCRCDCGEEVCVTGSSLRRGKVTSCGCKMKDNSIERLIDLAGKRFGRLTVIRKVDHPLKVKNRKRYWLCKCDCGNLKVILGLNIRKGYTKSCGCLRKKKNSLLTNS